MPLAHRRDHAYRGFMIRRSVSASSTPAPTASTVTVSSSITPTVRTLSIVGAVLCAAILVGVVFLWRLRVSKQKLARSPTLESKISREKNRYTYFGQEKIDSIYVEKPKATYSSGDLGNAGWTPQVTTYRGLQMTPKQLNAIKSSPKKYAKWEKALQLQVNSERSPPPFASYSGSDVDPSNFPLPPTPPDSAKRIPPTPPTPPATKHMRSHLLGPPLPQEPLPSPTRSTSFASRMHENPGKGKEMTVVNAFTPNMDDEIPITIGETVRLLAEFQDGWCLIQKLGQEEKGVVPRFCLLDQQGHRPLDSNYLF